MIRTFGPKLIGLGYDVVALARGAKRPYRHGWQSHPLSVDECKNSPETDGVGVLCGVGDAPICAVDVDISDDEKFARAFRALVYRKDHAATRMAIRIGKAPKFLMVFRAHEAGWRKTSSALFEKDGAKAQLEVLGQGNQFCAYHIHPDTKQPYRWEDETTMGYALHETRAQDIPVITWDMVQEFISEFERMALEFGYKKVESSAPTRTVFGDQSVPDLVPPTPPMPGVTLDRMRQELHALALAGVLDLGKGTHDNWVRLGMAIHHQTCGSADGLALWDEISALFPEAYDPRACAHRWATFKSDRMGAVTYRSYATKARLLTTGLSATYDDSGVVFRVMKEIAGRATYVLDKGTWYAFDEDEGRWDKAMGEQRVYDAIRNVVINQLPAELAALEDDDAKEALAKFMIKTQNSLVSKGATYEKYLRSFREMCSTSDEFDQTPFLLGVRNGVLNLRDMTVVPNNQELKVFRCCSVAYDPTAKCPTWEKGLRDWFCGDAEKIEYIKRLLGQMLIGAPSEDVMGILRGVGCNGKSVFLETVATVMGTYAVAILESTLLGYGESKAGSARADIVKLQGARFVYCSETSRENRLREADIKRLTGRDTITARAPYGRTEIDIKPTWLLVMGTNYLPNISGDDEGIWRRIADIEFPRNFLTDPDVQLDKHFADKLQREHAGILNWMLEGLRAYLEDGLHTPKAVVDSTQEYRTMMDVVHAWMGERLIRDTTSHELMHGQTLYTDFAAWMKMQGMDVDLNRRAFLIRLYKQIGQNYKMPKDAFLHRRRDTTHLVGFRLRTESDADLDDQGVSDDGFGFAVIN